jgi:hypothetical protein
MASQESSDRQNLFQYGKYSVNIDDGKDVHIGDRIFTDSKSIESIDWEKVSFERYLTNLQQLFTKHLHKDVERSTEENTSPYVSLKLQGIESTRSSSTSDIKVKTEDIKVKIGTWQELIQLPGTYFISGDSGGGKTTLLLNIAKELAVKAIKDQTAPIPIYLSLSRFRGEDSSVLLSMAANTSGQETRVLQGLYRDKHQPLCILLDGADEIPHLYIQSFIDNLNNLLSLAGTERHTLILTTRPGLVQDQLKSNLHTSYQELIILPLDNEQVDELLHRYSATALSDVLKLDNYLQTVIRNPGPLAAIAVSVQSIQQLGLPKNAGQIYKLLIDYHLAKRDNQQYDYWRVKRPILANLAFTIFSHDLNDLLIDDALCDQIAQKIEVMYRRYDRSRVVMPSNWSAQELLSELSEGEIIVIEDFPISRLFFKERIYLEYFTAVYFEDLDTNSSEIEFFVQDINVEKWINPLIFLSGLRKEFLEIFDKIFGTQPQKAVDIWLDKKPYGIEIPNCIASEFNTRKESLTSLSLINFDRIAEVRQLTRLLNSSSPALRLQAVYDLSQVGLSAIHALVDAAEDSHPIVQAIAQYIILHLGEPSPSIPQIFVKGRQFTFHCDGGFNARIGSLHLVNVPQSVQTSLTVNIERLDFDLFEEDSTFKLWYTSPALFAYSYFTSNRTVNWLELAARCQLIAEHSAKIAEQLNSCSLLSRLANELRLRATHYTSFGACIASELGLEWKTSKTLQPDWAKNNADVAYQQLKILFNSINRARTFGLTEPEKIHGVSGKDHDNDLHNINATFNIERISGGMFRGIEIQKNVDLQTYEQKDSTQFKAIDYTINCERLSEGELAGSNSKFKK